MPICGPKYYVDCMPGVSQVQYMTLFSDTHTPQNASAIIQLYLVPTVGQFLRVFWSIV